MIEMREDHIYIQFVDLSVVDLEEARIIAKHIIDLCNGKAMPFISDGTGITIRMDNEAREYLATYAPLLRVRKGGAMIVNNMPSKLLAGFYIKYHKPPKPTKIFTNFEDALQWCRSL